MFDTIIEEYEDMSFSDMNLKEATMLLKRFQNQQEYWKCEKEIAFNRTQPQATNIESERVNGGVITNKNDVYLIKCEKIIRKIKVLEKRINNLKNYIDREISIIEGYDPMDAKIIKLRYKEGKKWDIIAEATNYSVSQVKRKYYKYLDDKMIRK